jgi:acetyl/propionyl-CoA carboxylase alpha subunit
MPSPALDPDTREAMEVPAERVRRAIGHRNAGTFEFLLGPDRSFYFIELNCRLQVEHPVSELVTGIDIVREQLRIAAGEPVVLTGRAPRSGHAIELRINAEDPSRGFLPAPGTIERFRPPLGPFDRVDTCVEDGLRSRRTRLLIAKDRVTRTVRRRSARAERSAFEVRGVPTTREPRSTSSAAKSSSGATIRRCPEEAGAALASAGRSSERARTLAGPGGTITVTPAAL